MRLKFTGTKDEVENVKTFIFAPDELVSWEPGQYMHYVLNLPQADEKGPERWFTISAAPYEKNITITTRLDNLPVSSFKQFLLNLKPGDEVESDGPNGKFVMRSDAKKHILIAGGIGITPYRSMIAQLAHDELLINSVLLYANRDDKFIYDQELSDIAAKDSTFKIQKFVDQKITEDDLRTHVGEDTVFYLSGPRGMVESYHEQLLNMGVAQTDVMTDYFPGY